ncbi:hypothetical protein OAT94_01690 [Schleiferiaceae bacterium]|nr:hypothetical protein [Schleiferiaceae bacterium]
MTKESITMQYDDNNKGALWPAKDRASDKHPHFTGKAMVGGVEYYVSGWKRDPNGNPKAPSVKFSFKAVDEVKAQTMQQVPQQTQPAQAAPIDFDDDIPF